MNTAARDARLPGAEGLEKLQEHGIEKSGRLIDQNITQARYLTGLIEQEPVF
jgi:glutamate/tyrosine decarboxylase-like PLP-dependent enzyme